MTFFVDIVLYQTVQTIYKQNLKVIKYHPIQI